jgi:hypothetical protein
MKAPLSKIIVLSIAVSLVMGCAAKSKTQGSRNLGKDLGISYVSSITTAGTEAQYSLSHKGTAKGTVVGPHNFGIYLVKENFTTNYFLDGKPIDAEVVTLTANPQGDKRTGEGLQILWAPNLISSTGAFMFELVHCPKGCDSSTKGDISGSLYAGIISGPINPPVTFTKLTPGYWAMRLYEFRKISPKSNWLVFQVK